MPPKKICSDKAPLNNREWSVSTCYKRGLSAGFVAGIQTGTKQANAQGVRRAQVVRAVPEAALRMRVRRGVRRAQERVAQQAQERENALMAANDINIPLPRVRNPARRQQFRNFYGLDGAPEVVAQNPVAALPAPIVNIWDRVNRAGGKAQRGEAPTGGTRNRDELIAELVKNEPDLPQHTQGISTLKKLGKRRLIELLVGTGKYERGRENLGNK